MMKHRTSFKEYNSKLKHIKYIKSWVQNDKNVPPWVTVTGCWDINSLPKSSKYSIFPIGISQYPQKLVNKGLLSKNYSKLKQEDDRIIQASFCNSFWNMNLGNNHQWLHHQGISEGEFCAEQTRLMPTRPTD